MSWFVDISRACDLCNCLWGTDGNKICDVGLTARYAIPVIPFKCPRGYPPTKGYGNGNPIWRSNWKKSVMERIAKVERERRIISELAKKSGIKARIVEKRMRAGNRGWVGPISLKGVK